MDNNSSSVIKRLEARGKVEASKSMRSFKADKNLSAEAKKLEAFFKSSEQEFKKETGRPMTYAEMREMFG